jgi:Flp pilus assembly protein TadG
MRRNLARSKGASAVEMAIVAPVIVSLILGQIEASRLGMVAQLLTTAAREGCRVAVIQDKTQDDVQAQINKVLTGSGISVGTVTPTPSTWRTDPLGAPITVSLSVPYNQVSWLGTPFFLKDATVSAAATMCSEHGENP